jgi:hypothetical protein
MRVMPKYINIKVKLTGGDSNAFSIIALVTRAMIDAGVPNSDVEAYRAAAISGTYEELLQATANWVTIY